MNYIAELGAQLPIVAIVLVFVVYWSDRMDKAQKERDAAMRSFFEEQRKSDREILARLVTVVEQVEANITEHDRKTDTAIATMIERTQRAQARRKPTQGG